MSSNKFSTGYVIVLAALIVIAVALFMYKDTFFAGSTEASTPVVTETPENTVPPVFAWKFENDSTLNPDGNPRTNVVLEAKYNDGMTRRERIDTVDSSCSELSDKEADSLANTKDVQCYGAGLGFRYKITKGESSYLIMRQMFEEALPDTEPVQYQYVTVAEFPFWQ